MQGAYSEFTTLVDLLGADGQTRDYMFLLHYDGSAPLRFDVGESVGIVELEALTIRCRDSGAVVSWSGRSLDTAPFRLVSAIRTSGRRDEDFYFLSLNNDAHFYVDLPEADQFAGACQVDLTVGFRVLSEEHVQRAAAAFLREQTAAAAASAVLRAQVAAAPGAAARLAARSTISIAVWPRPARALESGAATVDALERRVVEADDRWQKASTRLEASEAAMAELRERSFRRSLELDGLREALAKSETRLGEVSQTVEALRQSRAYRMGRRFFDRRGMTEAAVAIEGARGNGSRAVSYSDLACLAQTPLFDEDFYLNANPEVRAAKLEPRMHYLCRGAAEGRDPSPWFNTRFYLAQYPDVATAGVNPLVHYVTKGAQEGRLPTPLRRSGAAGPCATAARSLLRRERSD